MITIFFLILIFFLNILCVRTNIGVLLTFPKFYWKGTSLTTPVLQELVLSASGWLYTTNILWLLKVPDK